MIRKIIEIDKEKCNGCGAVRRTPATRALSAWWTAKPRCSATTTATASATACRSARPARSRFVEREAAAYDEAAVEANMQAKAQPHHRRLPGAAWHGSMERAQRAKQPALVHADAERSCASGRCRSSSCPVNAPYFDGAKPAHRGRLHGLRLRRLPSAISSGGRSRSSAVPKLDEVRLQREADRNPPAERHPKRNRCPHGGAVLRRTGIRRPHRAAELRQAAAVAGEDHFHQGRTAGRLTDSCRFH